MDINKNNFSWPAIEQSHGLSADMILQQLHKILSSREFDGTKAQRSFLKFVVSKTIGGKSGLIKGYTVATEVFGRGKDFNQNTDPVVSIHANKLRRALERYYLIAGKTDPIHIDIPKGTYVPVFTPHLGTNPGSALTDKDQVTRIEDTWPSLLVLPFKNLTGTPDKDYLGIGFSTELANELARYGEIKILYPFEGPMDTPPTAGTRFVVNGSISQDQTGLKISVYISDTESGEHIWGEKFHTGTDASKMIAFQEKVAQVIAGEVAAEYGVIPKLISEELKNKPSKNISTYEAILRFYDFEHTLTDETFIRAMDALEHAVTIEPDNSQVCCALARLYTNIYSLDFPGTENPLEKAIEYAEKSVHLNPKNQLNRTTLALVRFFSNELSAALGEANRALALNPNSLYVLDALAYIMTLSGDWDRGTALAHKSIRLNPFYRPDVHYALWVDYLRQKKYDQAHKETMGLRRPAVFWYPLAKASTLGLLGRHTDGKRFVETLLELRPDFTEKGRYLIRHYIKFEDIVERIVEGLDRVGLKC